MQGAMEGWNKWSSSSATAGKGLTLPCYPPTKMTLPCKLLLARSVRSHAFVSLCPGPAWKTVVASPSRSCLRSWPRTVWTQNYTGFPEYVITAELHRFRFRLKNDCSFLLWLLWALHGSTDFISHQSAFLISFLRRYIPCCGPAFRVSPISIHKQPWPPPSVEVTISTQSRWSERTLVCSSAARGEVTGWGHWVSGGRVRVSSTFTATSS